MDKLTLERSAAIALDRIFGYEPATAREIIHNLGSASALFGLGSGQLRELFGPYSKYLPLINGRALEDAAGELEDLEARGFSFIAMNEDAYPSLLRECPDAPAGLYVRSGGSPESIFNRTPAIAIVGTRDMSAYGREWCERIVSVLSKAKVKPMIVSGLAMGIDITAHMAALGYGLTTAAVLPTGITEVYPKLHATAAARISDTPGCALVTDYPPGTTPQASTFIRRNRIIAGMTSATILVESRAKGGGLITARLANGYGRDVYALPGRIDDIRSAGCNRVLKEMIAEPIVSLEDLPEALGLGSPIVRSRKGLEALIRERLSAQLDGDELDSAVSTALFVKANRGVSLEGICRETGRNYGDVAALTELLASEGIISVDLLQRCAINPKIM